MDQMENRVVLNSNNSVKMVNYKSISKYHWQYFLLINAFNTEPYLLESPFKNKKNADRITKMWKPAVELLKSDKSPLPPLKNPNNVRLNAIIEYNNNKWKVVKLRKTRDWKLIPSTQNNNIETKTKRKAPNDSATKFKIGTKKRGNDNNMWIVVRNKNKVKRWKKI